MKIQWNKVTWYSKSLALALFVALPFIGFYFGEKYGEINGSANFFQKYNALTQASQNSTEQTSTDYYENVAAWQTDNNNTGWSIAYPIDFDINDNYSITPIDDWRQGTPGGSGLKPFTLVIPKVFEPQTNFAEATLSVGVSGDQKAIMQCLIAGSANGVTATSTATINGVIFAVIDSADAGAGNYYETTSYRTIHDGQCYTVEYTIHSGQIANYPSEYQLKPFDETKLHDVLDRIVGTFRFD